jgi:hypothetical protein
MTTFRACSSPAPTPVKSQPAPAILSQESVHTTLSITYHTRKRPSTRSRTTHGPHPHTMAAPRGSASRTRLSRRGSTSRSPWWRRLHLSALHCYVSGQQARRCRTTRMVGVRWLFVRPCRVARRVEAGRATYGCPALNRCGRQHGVVRMPRKLRRRRRSIVSMADCSAGHGWAPMGSRLGRSKRVGPSGSARLDRIGFLFIF